MPIKDLLLLLDGTAASRSRLELGLGLAQRFSARVTAMALVPHPYVPAMVGVHLPVELVQAQIAEAERIADRVLREAGTLAAERGVEMVTVTAAGPVDRLQAAFTRWARQVDLSVVGQPDDSTDLTVALPPETAFMDTGRPALIVPFVGAPATGFRRIMLAWDGSREAARAAHDALPFLRDAERTSVIVIDPEQIAERVGDPPGAEICAHLARHGVRAEVTCLPSGGIGVGNALLAQAATESAELLVMGGYGHSRMRQMILGGATRELLAQMTVPVLLSH